MRKFFVIFLLAAAATGAFAQSESDFKVDVKDGAVTITGYTGKDTAVVIPATIGGKPVATIGDIAFQNSGFRTISIPASVTSIGHGAFQGCRNLKSVTLPAGVTTIGNSAFSRCTGLTSISIPAGVTSIGQSAFSDCTSLTSIIIPAGVTSIEAFAFSDCTSITSISIPASVATIGNSAFSRCTRLTSVSISASVTNIASNAFIGCTSLSDISVDKRNPAYTSRDGVVFTKAGDTLVLYPAGKKGEQYAIPKGVTSIEACAFYDCTSLTSVSIPKSVTSIGDHAFRGCTGLTSEQDDFKVIKLGGAGGRVIIDKYTGKAAAVVIPATMMGGLQVTDIGSAFFFCSSLTAINIPTSVTTIGGNAFYGCRNLTSVNIPASVTRIGNSAFEDCTSLTDISVDSRNASYSSRDGVLFTKARDSLVKYPAGKKETRYAIPAGVTRIEGSAFEDCTSLASVSIPASVTVIGRWAFRGCTGLTSINVPAGVTKIEDGTFEKCSFDSALWDELYRRFGWRITYVDYSG